MERSSFHRPAGELWPLGRHCCPRLCEGHLWLAEVPKGLQTWWPLRPLACHLCSVARLVTWPTKLYCPWAADVAQVELGFMLLGDSTNAFHNVLACVDNTVCSVSFCLYFFPPKWVHFLPAMAHAFPRATEAGLEAVSCYLLHLTFVLPWVKGPKWLFHI